MKNKKRYCITMREILKEEAQFWAEQRGISLSAYITDAILWQISHDRRRKDKGEGLYKDSRK